MSVTLSVPFDDQITPAFLDFPELLAAHRIWVGFSGGLDSTVLLEATAAWGRAHAVEVAAVHVHHGMQPAAEDFVSHCEAMAASLDIPLTVCRVTVRAQGEGPEASARKARYEQFIALLEPDDVLLLAHHRQDQAETLLFRLLRGSGLHGLAGMPTSRPLGNGKLIRPFLHLPRACLRQYAEHRQLKWIEDPSNESPDFERGRLRRSLLPALSQHWPDHEEKITRMADRVGVASSLLKEVGLEDLVAADYVAPNREGAPQAPKHIAVVRWSAVKQMSAPRRLNLLYTWLAGHALRQLTEAQYQELDRQITQADNCHFIWSEGCVATFRDGLWLLRGQPPDALTEIETNTKYWQPESTATWDCGHGSLAARKQSGAGLRLDARETLSIRFSQPGDRILLNGKPRLLKKLFQDYAVPAWARPLMPLLCRQHQLVAVADLCIADDMHVETATDTGWHLSWQPSSDYARHSGNLLT